MERVNIHLTESELRDLRDLADKTGLSRSEIIRRAIDEAIEKVKNLPFTGIINISRMYNGQSIRT